MIFVIGLLAGCSSKQDHLLHSSINTYFFDQYTVEEQKVYDKVYTALINKQRNVDLDNTHLDMNKVFEIASQVSDDHPEFFYFHIGTLSERMFNPDYEQKDYQSNNNSRNQVKFVSLVICNDSVSCFATALIADN